MVPPRAGGCGGYALGRHARGRREAHLNPTQITPRRLADAEHGRPARARRPPAAAHRAAVRRRHLASAATRSPSPAIRRRPRRSRRCSPSSSSWWSAGRSRRRRPSTARSTCSSAARHAHQGVLGRHPHAPRQDHPAQDGGPEALRRRHPRRTPITFGIGPAGTGKTYLAMAMAVDRAQEQGGRPHHPHASGGRGGREARLPAGQPVREGRPVPAPALRRAVRHDGHREVAGADGARRHRGRAARVHARPHAQRQLHHPRRGAEHHRPSR